MSGAGIAPRRRWLRTSLASGALAVLPRARASQDSPTTIRIGAPAQTTQNDRYYGTMGIARYKGWFDEEFARDGIRVESVGFKGGAPMVGQALANKQIDFAGQGDLLSIIGRSAGLDTRLLLPFGKLSNAYLAVPAGSKIEGIADLRGKRVAYYKGNQIQLQVIRILAEQGMQEKDLRSVYMDPPTAAVSLTTGDIDAAFGSSELLTLRDRAGVRIVYSTLGKSFGLTAYNGLVSRYDFTSRHPDLTARLVKVLVRSAHWASEPSNRDEVLKIWSLNTQPAKYFAEDMGNLWDERLSPLLDPLLVKHYQDAQDLIDKLGLLRGPKFDVRGWIDPAYLNRALAQLGLQDRWRPVPAERTHAAG